MCLLWIDKTASNHHRRPRPRCILSIITAARRDGVRRAVAEGKCPTCWTPCEAYPAIGASPVRSLVALARGG
jgi:hypothetical protein